MKLPAAVLISAGMIFGLCAMVYQNRTPIIEGTANAAEPSHSTVRPDGQPVRRALPADGAPRFRQSSPVETEIAANRARPGALMASAPGELRSPELAPLPPLSHSAAIQTPPVQTDNIVSNHEFISKPTGEHRKQPDEVLLASQTSGATEPVVRHASSRDEQNDSNSAVAIAAEQPPAAEPSGTIYTVRAGDNLSRIAKRLLNSDSPAAVAAIVALNPSLKGRPDRIVVGQKLAIPDKTSTQTGNATAQNTQKTAPSVTRDRVAQVTPVRHVAEASEPGTVAKRAGDGASTKKSAPNPAAAAKSSRKPATGKSGTAVAQNKSNQPSRAKSVVSASRGNRSAVAATKATTAGNRKIASAGTTRTKQPRTPSVKSSDKQAESAGRDLPRNGTLGGVADTMRLAEAKPGLKPIADGRKTQGRTSPPGRPKKVEVVSGAAESRERTAGLKRVSAR